MKRNFFGTDGIRGRSNTGLITPEMMVKFAMGVSIANGSAEAARKNKHQTVVIGKDTRLSGYMLEFALTSGFISMGVNVVLVGPMPTPAISMLVRSLRADLGVMISASHNPFYDNGIKLFDAMGYKISKEMEDNISDLMNSDLSKATAESNKLGKATKLEDAKGRYIEKLKQHFPQSLTLDGIKIVVDCANGAAYDIAPKVFSELGAEVITHAVSPNGYNINEKCGVLATDSLSKLVIENKADIGIALDGDADRIVIVDEKGMVINGEQIIALIATKYHENKNDNSQKVVTTILANQGLQNYLAEKDIELIRTNVGDKHVVAKMRDLNLTIGGEPSGHIILGQDGATGDGIKVGLEILALYVDEKRNKNNITISKLLNVFTPLPQFSSTVTYNHEIFGKGIINQQAISNVAQVLNNEYGKKARIITRPSGTEPVIRIMVESADNTLAKDIMNKATDKVKGVVDNSFETIS